MYYSVYLKILKTGKSTNKSDQTRDQNKEEAFWHKKKTYEYTPGKHPRLFKKESTATSHQKCGEGQRSNTRSRVRLLCSSHRGRAIIAAVRKHPPPPAAVSQLYLYNTQVLSMSLSPSAHGDSQSASCRSAMSSAHHRTIELSLRHDLRGRTPSAHFGLAPLFHDNTTAGDAT